MSGWNEYHGAFILEEQNFPPGYLGTTVAVGANFRLCDARDMRHTIQCSYCKSKFVMREYVLQKCPNCGGTFSE